MAPQTEPIFPVSPNDPEPVALVKRCAQALWDSISQAYAGGENKGERARARALARTNLEQSVMWAEKGIVP